MDYPLFELRLRPGAMGNDSYKVVARFESPGSRVPHRTEEAVIHLPLSELTAKSLEPVAYGRQLFAAIFGPQTIASLWKSARDASRDPLTPLRFLLRLPPTDSRLIEVRWELMQEADRYAVPLGADEHILFVRHYEARFDHHPAPASFGQLLTALVVAPAPLNLGVEKGYKHYPPIPAEHEVEALERTVSSVDTRLNLRVLARCRQQPPTKLALFDALADRSRPVDILYIVTHGHQEGDAPWLMLEDEDGSVVWLSGQELVSRLNSLQHKPSLVILASCDSANSVENKVRASLAQGFSYIGVPAVIAIQGRIPLSTAQKFMAHFFRHFCSDGHIGQAVTRARAHIAGMEKEGDWWRPVLVSNLSDCTLAHSSIATVQQSVRLRGQLSAWLEEEAGLAGLTEEKMLSLLHPLWSACRAVASAEVIAGQATLEDLFEELRGAGFSASLGPFFDQLQSLRPLPLPLTWPVVAEAAALVHRLKLDERRLGVGSYRVVTGPRLHLQQLAPRPLVYALAQYEPEGDTLPLLRFIENICAHYDDPGYRPLRAWALAVVEAHPTYRFSPETVLAARTPPPVRLVVDILESGPSASGDVIYTLTIGQLTGSDNPEIGQQDLIARGDRKLRDTFGQLLRQIGASTLQDQESEVIFRLPAQLLLEAVDQWKVPIGPTGRAISVPLGAWCQVLVCPRGEWNRIEQQERLRRLRAARGRVSEERALTCIDARQSFPPAPVLVTKLRDRNILALALAGKPNHRQLHSLGIALLETGLPLMLCLRSPEHKTEHIYLLRDLLARGAYESVREERKAAVTTKSSIGSHLSLVYADLDGYDASPYAEPYRWVQ